MVREKKTAERRKEKVFWHPLSLQQLTPERFIVIAAGVLEGRYHLGPSLRNSRQEDAEWDGEDDRSFGVSHRSRLAPTPSVNVEPSVLAASCG